MGGSFSEPATNIDLGHSVLNMFRFSNIRDRINWNFENVPVDKLVFGLFHVDDGIVVSRIFCLHCLEQGILGIMPHDVGMAVEEFGPSLKFLHTDINVAEASGPSITPHNPNIDFALGSTPHPHVSRLAQFLDPLLQPFLPFRNYCISRCFTFDDIVRGAATGGANAIFLFGLEAMRLKWPQIWIAKSFRALPKRRNSSFVQFVRILGSRWAKHMLSFDNFRDLCLDTLHASGLPNVKLYSLHLEK